MRNLDGVLPKGEARLRRDVSTSATWQCVGEVTNAQGVIPSEVEESRIGQHALERRPGLPFSLDHAQHIPEGGVGGGFHQFKYGTFDRGDAGAGGPHSLESNGPVFLRA